MATSTEVDTNTDYARLVELRRRAQLLGGTMELLGPSRDFLLGYYRAETLDAGAARQRFFLPGRLP